jgi:putative metallohydrolase (TIGR04338 family)
VRDSQRSKVYHAENILRTMLDNARDNPVITIEGITLTLPPEAKFSNVEDVQRYVAQVTTLPSVVEAFGETKPVAVRSRKGQRVAHYERYPATIAVPERATRWALREVVILHEIAHHYSPSRPAHGPEFVSTLIKLLECVMGPEMGLLARILYSHNEVSVA